MRLYEMIAAFQRQGRTCALVLHAPADLAALTACGGDPDRLLVSQPETEQQGVDVCDALVRSGCVDLVVLGPSLDTDPHDWDEVARKTARLRDLSARHNCAVVFWGGEVS